MEKEFKDSFSATKYKFCLHFNDFFSTFHSRLTHICFKENDSLTSLGFAAKGGTGRGPLIRSHELIKGNFVVRALVSYLCFKSSPKAHIRSKGKDS